MKSKKNKKHELAAKYKSAFDEICGDPYSLHEPTIGQYESLKTRSSIAVMEPMAQSSPSPENRARPNHLDFFVDVESSVMDGLLAYQKNSQYEFNDLLTLFDNTYWLETGDKFTQKERAEVEQHVGRILVARKISPITKYFTAIRKGSNGTDI